MSKSDGTPAPARSAKAAETAPLPTTWRLDLFRSVPALRRLVASRWFPFVVVLPNLLLLVLFIAAGIFGSPAGNQNMATVFVWIVWWFLLIVVLVPFAARGWCMVCPLPFFGEWFQRRALVGVGCVGDSGEGAAREGPGVVVGRNRYFGWNLRWPSALANMWPQNVLFLCICSFSAALMTRPVVTAGVLAAMLLLATVLHTIFRHRVFCRYVCPVSGFLSLYAMSSATELRARDAEVCAACTGKDCLAGNQRGWGCPWSLHPSRLSRNNHCGLCMECVKTCSHENITVRLRPFGDAGVLYGYDEAWKAFIMLATVLVYSVVYLGPWGKLRDLADVTDRGDWAGYLGLTAGIFVLALVLLPGVHYVAVRLGRWLAGPHAASAKEVFLGLASPLAPLGLLAWVAFSIPLVLANGYCALVVLSDPFGWGWDLFGTASLGWAPVVPHWTPYIQALVLLVGLHFGLRAGCAHAARLFPGDRTQFVRAFLPVAVYQTAFVAGLLWLHGG